MARANLIVGDDILDAWKRAQSEEGVHYLEFRVDTAEIHLKDLKHLDESSREFSLRQVFDAAFVSLVPGTEHPIVAAVRHTPFPAGDSLSRWTIISYSDEGLPPRLKMKTAASRDDIKRKLGSDAFTADYHATDKDAWNADAFLEWFQADGKAAMTESEKVKAAVLADFNAERSAAVAAGGLINAMAPLQYKFSPELTEALLKLKATEEATEESINWIEISVAPGVITVVDSAHLDSGDIAARALAAVANQSADSGMLSPNSSARETPRYFVFLRRGDEPILSLLFYCSEATAPKSRMTYGAAKATIIEELAKMESVLSVHEARDADDLQSAADDICKGVVHAPRLASPMKAALSSHSLRSPGGALSPSDAPASSPQEEIGFAKPSRPGRGGARMVGGIALPGLPGMSSP